MVPKMLVLALFVGSACAATWRGSLPMKPKEFMNKEGCYIKEINNVIPFEETITPLGYCYRISCGRHMINYDSCGVIFFSDKRCHKTATDLSKPHPQCCPKLRCDWENDISKDATENEHIYETN